MDARKAFLKGLWNYAFLRKDFHEAALWIEKEVTIGLKAAAEEVGAPFFLRFEKEPGWHDGEAQVDFRVTTFNWSGRKRVTPVSATVFASRTYIRMHELGHIGVFLEDQEQSSFVRIVRPAIADERRVNNWVKSRLPEHLQQTYMNLSYLAETTYYEENQ